MIIEEVFLHPTCQLAGSVSIRSADLTIHCVTGVTGPLIVKQNVMGYSIHIESRCSVVSFRLNWDFSYSDLYPNSHFYWKHGYFSYIALLHSPDHSVLPGHPIAGLLFLGPMSPFSSNTCCFARRGKMISQTCWDIWVVVSLATPQHKHVQTQTVLYACPVLYILHLLRCHLFDFRVLSSHRSIISNRLWAKLTYLCCILCLSVLPLCHSESSESSGVFSVLFAPICISGREPFVPIWVSGRIYLCLLRWSALIVYLCIVSLICELMLLALHSSRCLLCWDLVICWWEDHQTLHWLIFILSPSPPPLATLV